MNWTNFNTLVEYLRELRATRPETFDYTQPFTGGTCGCVAYHIERAGWTTTTMGGMSGVASSSSIRRFLEVTYEEASEIYMGYVGLALPQRKGVQGIDNALVVLERIAAKYERPLAPATEPPPFKGDEVAFVAALRAVAGEAAALGRITS